MNSSASISRPIGHVPLVPDHRLGDPAVADLVAARIAAALARGVPIRTVILDRLGPNVWHRTPGEASAVLEELEETARLWLTSERQAQPLSTVSIDELCAAFGLGW